MTISLEMVVPGLAGYWLDRRLAIKGLFTVIGFGLGLVVGMWHLMRIARRSEGVRNEQEPGPNRS